jgi:predicted DNA-binding transcriptional regulator YafY
MSLFSHTFLIAKERAHMHDNKSQMTRLLFIKQEIKGGKYPNCKKLAEAYEVSTKTILRDIEYLKYQRDAPIEYDPLKKGYYFTEPEWDLPALSLSEGDAFAICIAEKALEQYKDTPLHPKLKSVFDRIAKSLPEGSISLHPAWVNERISFMPHPPRHVDPKIWTTLAKAVASNSTVAITHKTPLKPQATRRVDPYHLVNYHGEWYLIGLCHKENQIRNFAVSRISVAEPLRAKFVMPDEACRAAMFKNQFGIMHGDKTYAVSVQFSQKAAPYAMERTWHAHQTVVPQKNGGVIISFEANHLAEVRSWVLSWGSAAKAISPPELVDSIKTELAQSSAAYQ